MNKVTIRVLLPLLLILNAGSIYGQGVLEEVIITAQKRAQSAQDVPLSITALSGEFIDDKNIGSVKDLQNFTPGLRVAQQDASKTFIRIRGVGSRKFDIGSSGSVGVYIDEIYIPRVSGVDIGLLDLDRVEVLKGPQGTLFGRNTAAGAISTWTRRPSEERQGFIEAGVANEESYIARGAISGAVSNSLSMRVALGQQYDGGFQSNSLTGTSDDKSTTTARVQALLDVSDTLSVLGSVQYTKRDQDALLQKNIPQSAGNSIAPLLASPFVSVTANRDFRRYPIDFDGSFDYDTLFASIRVEKDFEHFQLVSTSGYLDGDGRIANDFDSSEARIGFSVFDEQYDTFSQEIRLVGERWLGGVYYYQDDAYSDYLFNWLDDSIIALFQPGVSDNGPIDLNTSAWAVFGEYTFDLSDALSLTLGGRYSVDEIDFTLSATTNAPGIPPTVAEFEYSDKREWNSFDPKISLSYHLDDDVLLYMTYSEGYKAGGVQFTASTEAVARELFDPEELTAYEVGFKSDLLNGSLRLNGSAFYYDYQDLQVQRVDLALSGGIPVAFTTNAAESEITGLELEVNWVPIEGLDIRFAYSYLNTEYKDFTGPNGEDFSGNPLPVSPENTLVASLSYSTALGNAWVLSLSTDWTWVDDYNFDVTDDDPFTKGGDYALGAARVALTSPDASWTVSAFVNNLNDEQYYAQMTRRQTEVIASAAEGRRYGLRVRFEF